MTKFLQVTFLLLLLPLVSYAQPQKEMRAHFIDVGQGDATLLEFPCGAVLIDAGGQNGDTTKDLLRYLRDFFTSRPDLNQTFDSIIITHNHVDHTRALREVVESFKVERFIENGQRGGFPGGDKDVDWVLANQNLNGRSIKVFDLNDSLIVDNKGYTDKDIDPLKCSQVDPKLRVLSADLSEDPGWDINGEEFADKNNHSLVLRVDFGKVSFLFTGDLEEHAIETMIEWYEGTRRLNVDVYQVGHHGSHNGTTESLMKAMTPEIAVISMSNWEDHAMWTGYRHGHPRKKAVEVLKKSIDTTRPAKSVHIASGVKRFYVEEMTDAIYATGWDGTVVITANKDGNMSVATSE